MANINVRVNLRGVRSRLERLNRVGQYALANQVHADSNNYAPFLTGDLRSQSAVSTDGKSIIWNAPYARRQYFNVGAKFTTPGTGPKWDQKAKAIHGGSWADIVSRSMR